MEAQIISDKLIDWHDLKHLIVSPKPVRLSQSSKKLIKTSNDIPISILNSGEQIYGVNTGFGKLALFPSIEKILKSCS